ncbi:MAG: stage sporulation protein [Bacillales bacterium]|nr:stage sporulation protein [Bacillales bacterium]
MKKCVPYFLIAATIFISIIILPTILVSVFEKEKVDLKVDDNKKTVDKGNDSEVLVSVFRTKSNKIEEVPLEEYVMGVVSSEMPADFEIEALKAQALSARTNIVLSKLNGVKSGKGEVSDSTSDQVYKSEEELKVIWGNDFTWKNTKIKEAVEATNGQILTYNGNPITASFFSTSNGRTENSEEYWSTALPYLKSVESPWDLDSPKYQAQTAISVSNFEKKLNVKLSSATNVGIIKKKTIGGRIAEIEISGKLFTGRKIREELGLRSTDFSLTRNGKEIIVQTKGYGHGVGMSQYGANGLATDGKKYMDIISYYYQGVQISKIDSLAEVALIKK